jgi:hypothetical protein
LDETDYILEKAFDCITDYIGDYIGEIAKWHLLTGMNFTSERMMLTLMPHFVMNK